MEQLLINTGFLTENKENDKMDGNNLIHSTVNDVINRAQIEQWVHFDKIEIDKLQWMQDIPNTPVNLQPNEQYEARFNWQGELLPFMFDDSTNQSKDQQIQEGKELYLHGDEPQRPGYTLQELFRLSRSTILQQRHFALKAIVGILDIYQRGYYDKVIDLPITNIFFLLRFAMDENTEAIVEVAAMGLALLFYNESDEVRS